MPQQVSARSAGLARKKSTRFPSPKAFFRFPRFSNSWQKLTKREKLIRIVTILTSLAIVGVLAGFFVFSIVVAIFSKNLPTPDKLVTRDVSVSTKILDRNGKTLYDIYGDENRQLIKLEELPDYVKWATLATEDNEFYKHHGFDIKGIVYATFKIVVTGNLRSGSTITQQLIKNALLSSEQTVTRKIKELVLAVQIESGTRYTKDDILQMYLNEVPYGGQALGIEAGAQMYFGKSARELTLAESALMAGLPQAPSLYSPFGAHPENAKARQEHVLRLMRDKGWIGEDGQWRQISDEQYQQALAEELHFAPIGQDIKAPHFVMFVRHLLTERYGEEMVQRGGLTVTTSLDYEMQQKAEEIVKDEVDKASKLLVGNGALVAMDPKTGQILAMVGSKDYFDTENDGNVNVVLALRQPGSSIKPITYVTGIKQGYTAGAVFMDVPTDFFNGEGQPPYHPVNYDGKFRGPIKMREALGNSINIPAVKMLRLVGIKAMLETAHSMGITSLNEPKRYGLALTLGGGEVRLLDMATVFSTFASGGVKRDPVAILKVQDSKGRVLEEWKPTAGRRALREEEAFIISDILSDNNARLLEFGADSPLKIAGYQVAVKTGTTDDKRDNWTIGYTPSLVTGVWVGNNDNSPMHRSLASGITGAAPIWHRFMEEMLKTMPKEEFKIPEGVAQVEISKRSGKIPQEGEERVMEYFIKGTEPTTGSSLGKFVDICKEDGKLATDHCRRFGTVETAWHEYYQALLPEWQADVDKWVEENLHHPNGSAPDAYSTSYLNPNGNDEPIIDLKQPARNATVGKSFVVEADAFSPYKITQAEFRLDGDLKATATGDSTAQNLRATITTDKTGEVTVEIKVTDENGATGTLSFAVTIPSDNHNPQASDDSYTTPADTDLTKTASQGLLANDTDEDGDSLTVSDFDSASAEGGTVSANSDGSFTYTPPAGFTGTDHFSYTVSDGNGGSAVASVSIEVG